MDISYETSQQFLTYAIEFFGFLAIFVLPFEYIIKCHFETVNSWGRPGEGLSIMTDLPQKPLNTEETKEDNPINREINEIEKPTTTKTKRRKKKELVTA